MAIRIEDSPEPLSERSLSPGAGTLLLVEAEATRVLKQELRRYCEGNIAGRSFLIAGHRGAGKTTLVHKAFLDVWRDCENKAEFLRPLFIALHGPSLFPPAEESPPPKPPAPPRSPVHWTVEASSTAGKPAAAATAGQSSAAAAAPAPATRNAGKPAAATDEKSEAQVALEQITLGLHRAVTKEFVHRYYQRAGTLAYLRYQEASVRQRLEELHAKSKTAAPDVPYPTLADLDRLLRALPSDRELGALAARLEIELHEGPTPQRLHELWARIESVSGGVLFREGYAPHVHGIPAGSLPPPGLRFDLPNVHGQGVRELVALSGVVEAYRRISGAVSRTDTQGDKRSQSEQRESGFELGAKELVVPIVSLLTGTLAGVGAAAAGGGGFVAVVTGIATALGSGLVLKVSKTRKRDRTAERAESFIPDLTVATLDRVLPLLIDRLRAAGLAPVFVVDELDKVEGLSKRILSMVKHLKKLVSENAFFCFLANRSYYEEMQSTGAGRPYPIEYTYYTHHLFVVFSPEDFERYLRRRIPDPLQAAPAGTAGLSEQESDEANACTLLRWVLRHRSQLHMVDLQREIAALRGDGDVITADLKQVVSSQRNRIEATMQVAIELRVADPQVQQVLADRPDLRRLLNDAVYYLTRQWLANEESVELTPKDHWPLDDKGKRKPPQCFHDFVAYLEGRTGRDEERPAGAGAEGAPPSRGVASNSEFLYEQVGLLADFLSDRPAALPGAASTPPVGSVSTGTGTSPDWRRDARDRWNERRVPPDLAKVEGSFWDSLLLRGADATVPDSVLVRVDPHRWEYRYRYDAVSATPRVAAARPQPAATSAEGPEDRVQTGLPQEPERQAVVDEQVIGDIGFVTNFAAAVEEVQRDANEVDKAPLAKELVPVTLGTLASPFGVISPSPAWSVVANAVGRLDIAHVRGASYSTQKEDELLVAQFRDLLTRNAQRIARALSCAAFVGRGTSTSRRSRIARGLAPISQAYAFAQRDEEAVAKALENVIEQIKEAFGLEITPGEVAIQTLAGIETYMGNVRAAIEEGERPVRRGQPELEYVEHHSWQQLFDRLDRWITTGQPGTPEVVELHAAAAQRGPSRLLRYDPREMTIADWVRVLVATAPSAQVADPTLVPSWLRPFAMHALGFHRVMLGYEAARKWLQASPPEQAAKLDAAEWTRVQALAASGALFGGEPPTTTLVVIRRNISEKLVTWMPTPGIGALIATAAELEAIIGERGTTSLPLIAPTERQVIAVEMEPELPSKLRNEIYPAIAVHMSRPWLVHVYWQDRGREMVPPFVVNPAGLQEIVDAAAKHQAPLPGRG